jgi:N-methylhydantoinase A
MVFSDARIRYVRSDAGNPAAVAEVLNELAASANRFLAESGNAVHAGIDYWVEARYPQQTWEIEVPIAWPTADRKVDIAGLAEDFHAAHKALYAVSDPASPVEFIAWRVRASTSLGQAADARLHPATRRAPPSRRRIWLDGWTEVEVHRLAAIPAEARLAGPAIVESALTSIFLPPDCQARRLASGTLEVTA